MVLSSLEVMNAASFPPNVFFGWRTVRVGPFRVGLCRLHRVNLAQRMYNVRPIGCGKQQCNTLYIYYLRIAIVEVYEMRDSDCEV